MDVNARKIMHLGDYQVEESFKLALREANVLNVIVNYDFNSKYYNCIKVLENDSMAPAEFMKYCVENGHKAKASIYEKVIDGNIWVFKMYLD